MFGKRKPIWEKGDGYGLGVCIYRHVSLQMGVWECIHCSYLCVFQWWVDCIFWTVLHLLQKLTLKKILQFVTLKMYPTNRFLLILVQGPAIFCFFVKMLHCKITLLLTNKILCNPEIETSSNLKALNAHCHTPKVVFSYFTWLELFSEPCLSVTCFIRILK